MGTTHCTFWLKKPVESRGPLTYILQSKRKEMFEITWSYYKSGDWRWPARTSVLPPQYAMKVNSGRFSACTGNTLCNFRL